MAEAIAMPRLGWTMEEGTLVEWLKADGDTVEAGEILFTVESDKALNEIETFSGGILRIPPDAPRPGDTVPVGTLLGYLLQPGEEMPTAPAPTPAAEPVPPPAEPAPVAKPDPSPNSCADPLRRADHQPPRSTRGLGAWSGMARTYGQWAHGPDRRARCSCGCLPQRPSGSRDPNDRSRRHRVGDVAPAAQGGRYTGTCLSPPDCQASGRRFGRLPPVECRGDRGCPPQSRRRYGRWLGESGHSRRAYQELGRTRGRGALPSAAGAAARLGSRRPCRAAPLPSPTSACTGSTPLLPSSALRIALPWDWVALPSARPCARASWCRGR